MKNRYIYLALAVILIFSIVQVSATCTLTLSKSSYAPTETAIVSAVCDATNEKTQAYVINWTNETGSQLEVDTGTTPSTSGQVFTQSYLIPVGYAQKLNVNMTGTNLEGTAQANVTGAPANSLLIVNITNGGKWVSTTSSTSAMVKDENGKKISGAQCRVVLYDNAKSRVLFTAYAESLDGQVNFVGIATYSEFLEGVDYVPSISCTCGIVNTTEACVDEDGVQVSSSVGTADAPFTMNKWVSFVDEMNITYANSTNIAPGAVFYAGFGRSVYWLSNKTNNYAQNLVDEVENFIVNNATGFTGDGVHSSFAIKANESFSRLRSFEIPASTPTGLYYIRQYHNIYYQNILVAQYILKTQTFNVTGTSDSFQFNGVTMDKTEYYTGSQLNICANITSTYDTRVEFEISYRYRCGNATDTTQQSAIDTYTEIRGVNPNANQVRCANLIIPYSPVLSYRTSSCQAIATVKSDFINTFDNKITLQGPLFNITDFGMYPEYQKDPEYPMVRLSPDWRRFDTLVDGVARNYFRAKINITKINETNLDPNNKIGDADWDVYASFSENMPCSTDIYNYSVLLANGSTTARTVENKALQWKDKEGVYHKACSLGIENVNFSNTADDYFEVYVWYEDFMERQTQALESMNLTQALISGALTQINSSLINLTNYISQQTAYLGTINSSLYTASLYLWNINGSLVATSAYTSGMNWSLFNSQNYVGGLNTSATTGTGYLYSINGSLYLSRVALEDIANKTGLFKLAIDCPSEGVMNSDMTCLISAQIESSDTTEKEVSFRCYIEDGISELSEVDFNQMLTQTEKKIEKSFNVPGSLTIDKQYNVKCEASYYNLGSRTDTFSDSFTVQSSAGKTGAGGGAESVSKKLGAQLFAIGGRVWPDYPPGGTLVLVAFCILIFILVIRFAVKKDKEKETERFK